MLDCILIGPSPELSGEIQRLCTITGDIVVYKAISGYGNRYEAVRLVNVLTPQLIFLELADPGEAARTVREIRAVNASIPIVGYGCAQEEPVQAALKEAGINSFLLPPFSIDRFRAAVVGAVESESGRAKARVFSFVPAKAGSGASILALNTAGAVARNDRRSVALLDADMHSGILALLTGVAPENSIAEALANARSLDDRLWAALAVRVHRFDLLAAPKSMTGVPMFSAWDHLHLLSFVKARYDCVIVDLPEVINDGTEALVTRSDRVFLVCSPELPSLALTRRRIGELLQRGVENEQLGVLVNRFSDRGLRVRDVEKSLGRSVDATFPNDYPRVCKVGLEASLLEGRSHLAQALADFATRLAGKSGAAEKGKTGALARALQWCTDM
jgi:pilus assembly protein CpaE